MSEPTFHFHQMRHHPAESLGGIDEDVRNAVGNLTTIVDYPPQRSVEPGETPGPLYDTEELILLEIARDQLKTVQRILWWVAGDPS